MKNPIFASICLLVTLASCNWINKSVHGNGDIVSQDRKVSRAEKIVIKGNFDVILTHGTETAVMIKTDENLQKLILMSESEGELVFKTKQKFNLKSDHGIKIYITTPKLTGVYLAGSGNIVGKGKFVGADKLIIDIAGQGDVELEVNTPKVDVGIKGSGNVNLKGETKNASFDIAGSGDCNAETLKAENASIKVAGNGNVNVYADVKLDIKIMGSGDVFYKGNAEVSQKVLGSGNIKKVD
jgi:hypothetical protein